MPNNTTIELQIAGDIEVLDLFIESHILKRCEPDQYSDETHYFDFNTIIPMPASIRSNDSIEDFMERSKWTQEQRDEYDKAQEIKAAANQAKYGHGGWYEWSCANWGVKWNSYDNNLNTDYGTGVNGEGSILLCFQTAWTIPEGIFKELSELYPELLFEVECLEEGGGFAGTIVYQDGTADESGLRYDIEGWRETATNMLGWEFDENGDLI